METKWNTASLNILLTDTSHNLRNVDIAAFTASKHHVPETILGNEPLKRKVARLVSGIIQSLVNLSFEALLHSLAGLRLQFTKLRRVDDLLDSAFVLVQDVCDSLRNLLLLDDDVLNTNREAVVD